MERMYVIGYPQAGTERILMATWRDGSGYPIVLKTLLEAQKEAKKLSATLRLTYIVFEAITAYGPSTPPVVELPLTDAK
jgi:hypothetical protein